MDHVSVADEHLRGLLHTVSDLEEMNANQVRQIQQLEMTIESGLPTPGDDVMDRIEVVDVRVEDEDPPAPEPTGDPLSERMERYARNHVQRVAIERLGRGSRWRYRFVWQRNGGLWQWLVSDGRVVDREEKPGFDSLIDAAHDMFPGSYVDEWVARYYEGNRIGQLLTNGKEWVARSREIGTVRGKTISECVLRAGR